MKIAIISDIHGNIDALEAVLEDINKEACDEIICGGDLVGYGPRPNEVVEKIRTLNIKTVMGNYDEAVGFLLPACGCHVDNPFQKKLSSNSLKWSIENTDAKAREFLRTLPESLELSYEDKKILLIHASEDSFSEYIYEQNRERLEEIAENFDGDIYIFGHTHFPFSKEFRGKLFINAGSVGRPKTLDNRANYIIMNVNENNISTEFKKVKYDVEKVAKEIEATALDPYFADFLRNGGDVYNSSKVKIESVACYINN